MMFLLIIAARGKDLSEVHTGLTGVAFLRYSRSVHEGTLDFINETTSMHCESALDEEKPAMAKAQPTTFFF
jgi:hypothetical protein